MADQASITDYERGFLHGLDAAAKHIVKLRFEQGAFHERSTWTREEAWAAITLALESAAADLETLKPN